VSTSSSPLPTLRPVKGLTRWFVATAVLDILFQLAVLGLIIGGIVSPYLLGAGVMVLLVVGPAYTLVSLAQRVLGSLALGRHVGNLRRMGITGQRLSPWAWLVFWLPQPTRFLWVLPYVFLRDQPWSHAVWVVVAVVAIVGSLLLHEVWRATEPDQIDHWRQVPLSGVVVGWGAATLVDALIPVVQPFGILATIVLLRRLSARMRDKAVVVAEVGLPGSQASATSDAGSDLPLSAGSAP